MIFLPFWYCFVLCYDFNTFWAFLVVIKGLSRNIDLRKYNILTKSFAIEFVLRLNIKKKSKLRLKFTKICNQLPPMLYTQLHRYCTQHWIMLVHLPVHRNVILVVSVSLTIDRVRSVR